MPSEIGTEQNLLDPDYPTPPRTAHPGRVREEIVTGPGSSLCLNGASCPTEVFLPYNSTLNYVPFILSPDSKNSDHDLVLDPTFPETPHPVHLKSETPREGFGPTVLIPTFEVFQTEGE